jgi:hypothetical protein
LPTFCAVIGAALNFRIKFPLCVRRVDVSHHFAARTHFI